MRGTNLEVPQLVAPKGVLDRNSGRKRRESRSGKPAKCGFCGYTVTTCSLAADLELMCA